VSETVVGVPVVRLVQCTSPVMVVVLERNWWEGLRPREKARGGLFCELLRFHEKIFPL